MLLNPDQQHAYDAAVAGYNLFVTGGAGTGKSVLVRAIKQRLRSLCIVAAPTGLAALNIDGVTVHSLFKNGGGALKEARTLILDEVSMTPPDMISRLVGTAKRVRECDAPWGGLQVILVGDMAQIPPVSGAAHQHLIRERYDGNPYFHGSRVFAGFRIAELSQIMRQADPILCNALSELRFGQLTPAVNAIFDRCVALRPANTPALVTTNKRASEINQTELATLPGVPYQFEAQIDGDVANQTLPADLLLTLKVGARVVVLRNGDGVANGDTGTVVDLDGTGATVQLDRGARVDVTVTEWAIKEPRVEQHVDAAGKLQTRLVEVPVGTFRQLPLRLGWAISVHKAQGLTLERAHVDLGDGTFCHGQAYVALSRCRSLDGLTLERPLRAADIIFDARAFDYARLFAPLDRIVPQVKGCSIYNRSGRPFRGDEHLPNCPLTRKGCPRLCAIAAGGQHGLQEKAA
ncbi:DNA repair and recombination protein, putative helicase [Hyphomicrobium sulfonivorans]|uniref:DNA repair and recombination protein, putative helicase n=1 Tax=Hyphomicrobium sulfonivorans TaxID=121290 RepID=A0A109BES5_HYPSL|nr:AAA family ATPase [Hyphomicrobium sulfonivorans]KWT67504.1 DNA repair and recombination protein, putative helicase [Hyphomicrobium sulfonivorans]